MVAEILRDSGAQLHPNPEFDPRRQPIIRAKPTYICLCEQVTEAEIVDACHHGVPILSLDAIKRRTRAGQGWCQVNDPLLVNQYYSLSRGHL